MANSADLLVKLNTIPITPDDIRMVVGAMEKQSGNALILIAGCDALSNLSCDMISSGELTPCRYSENITATCHTAQS